MSPGEKYTVILPTYQERRNLPIVSALATFTGKLKLTLSTQITWLLERTFREKYKYPAPHILSD